jgi:DNA-binding NtrC family response regulator
MARILCLDDETRSNAVLAAYLEELGHDPVLVSTVGAALQQVSTEDFDLVITDFAMPGMTGIEVLKLLRERQFDIPVIILTAYANVEDAVGAIKLGAVNYLSKPLNIAALETAVTHAVELQQLRREVSRLRAKLTPDEPATPILGSSDAIRQVMRTISAVAPAKAAVLIQGESGTGKELVARAVHEQSDRRHMPFVRLNCAAIPEGLIEAALFGHEKGAFTGAVRQAAGAFERANGGTLLLDEISEMRLDLQAKLLRVLQEFEFERVGGSRTLRVDVRVIATTNRDLAADAREGRFRQDLFYRLNVVSITVPPLRTRPEDIPVLAMQFLLRSARDMNKRIDGIDRRALELLLAHRWPGNVRELEHAMERAVILAQDPLLGIDLFRDLRTDVAIEAPALRTKSTPSWAPDIVLSSFDLAEAEQRCIDGALAATNGNRTAAARLLGIHVRTLRRKLNETGEFPIAEVDSGANSELVA